MVIDQIAVQMLIKNRVFDDVPGRKLQRVMTGAPLEERPPSRSDGFNAVPGYLLHRLGDRLVRDPNLTMTDEEYIDQCLHAHLNMENNTFKMGHHHLHRLRLSA
jgi:hypothetical protein